MLSDHSMPGNEQWEFVTVSFICHLIVVYKNVSSGFLFSVVSLVFNVNFDGFRLFAKRFSTEILIVRQYCKFIECMH